MKPTTTATKTQQPPGSMPPYTTHNHIDLNPQTQRHHKQHINPPISTHKPTEKWIFNFGMRKEKKKEEEKKLGWEMWRGKKKKRRKKKLKAEEERQKNSEMGRHVGVNE